MTTPGAANSMAAADDVADAVGSPAACVLQAGHDDEGRHRAAVDLDPKPPAEMGGGDETNPATNCCEDNLSLSMSSAEHATMTAAHAATGEVAAAAAVNGSSVIDWGSTGTNCSTNCSTSCTRLTRKDACSAVSDSFTVEKSTAVKEPGAPEDAEEVTAAADGIVRENESGRYDPQRERALAAEILLSSHIKPVDLMSAEILPLDEDSEESALWKLKRKIRLKLLEAEAGGGSTSKETTIATTAATATTVTDGRSLEARPSTRPSSNYSGGRTPEPHISLSVGPVDHPSRVNRVVSNNADCIPGSVHVVPQSPPSQYEQQQENWSDRSKPLVKVKRRTIMDLSSSEDEKDVPDSEATMVRNPNLLVEEPPTAIAQPQQQQQQQQKQENYQVCQDPISLQQHSPKLRLETDQELEEMQMCAPLYSEEKENPLVQTAEAEVKQQQPESGDKELTGYRASRTLDVGTQADANPLESPSELFSSMAKSSGGSEGPGSISALAAIRKFEEEEEVSEEEVEEEEGAAVLGTVQNSTGTSTLGPASRKRQASPEETVVQEVKKKPRGRPKGSLSRNHKAKATPKSKSGSSKGKDVKLLHGGHSSTEDMTEYEKQRESNVRRNQMVLERLQICAVPANNSKGKAHDHDPSFSSASEYSDRESNQDDENDFSSGAVDGCEGRREKGQSQKKKQQQYEKDDDEELDEEKEEVQRKTIPVKRVSESRRSASECKTFEKQKARRGKQQQQQQHAITLRKEVDEKLPKEKAPRGRPRKNNIEKAITDNNSGTQINQTLLKLLFELVKNGGGSMGSISQEIIKLENSTTTATGRGGEQQQKRGAGGPGRGRKTSRAKSPKAKLKPTGRPKKSATAASDNASMEWGRSSATGRERKNNSVSTPSRSSSRALVSGFQGRGKRRKDTWLTTIPYETPKCEYEIKRDENLRSHHGELERLGVVVKDLVQAPRRSSRQTKSQHKRWNVTPNSDFARETRFQLRGSSGGGGNNNNELAIQVKREESISDPNLSSEAEDTMDIDSLAPEVDYAYSAVVDFMEMAQLQELQLPPAGHLEWKTENTSTATSSRVVSFHSEVERQQLQDPLLTRIYTLDVGRFSGQHSGVQLLAAGGTQGRISVFAIPASENVAESRRMVDLDKGAAAAVNSNGGAAAASGSALDCKGPLLSWAVEGSWISQVLLLPTRFQENQILLLSSSNDGRVVLWDINQVRSRAGSRQLTQEGMPRVVSQTNTLHTGCIFGMHELNCRMATAADDCVGISVIRETMVFMERFIAGHHTGTIRNVKFRDSNVLADCGTDKMIGILDLRCPEPCALKISTAHRTGMSLVEWSPSSDHVLLSASLDPQLYLHDIRSPGLYQHVLQGHVHPRRVKCYSVYRPAFVDGGSLVVSPGEGTHHLTLYSTKTGALTRSIPVGYDTTILHWNGQNLWAACSHITKFAPMWGPAGEQHAQQQELLPRSHYISSSSNRRGASNSLAPPPPAYLEELL